jgi:hypothetical protein
VLSLATPGSSLSDLEVLIPSGGSSAAGLYISGAASNVSVVAATGATEAAGVELAASSSFSGTIDLRAGSAPGADDLTTEGNDSVTDSVIEGGGYGIYASGTLAVSATRILGIVGVDVEATGGSDVTVKDSLLTLGSPCTAGCLALYAVDSNSDPGDTLVATQDTLVAGTTAMGQPAGSLAEGNTATYASETTQVTLDSTVAVDFPATGSSEGLGLECFGPGTSGLTVIYSSVNFDNIASNGCTSHFFADNENQGSVANTPLLPVFVNAAAGDYHIPYTSPLVDAGDPSLVGGTDLDGNPRVVNGKGTGTARSDIGAYEYQRAAPIAKISAPATATVDTPVTFDGTGSTNPNDGEGLTYAWKFDTGYSPGSPSVGYDFTTAGTHTVSLTVTAPTGLTSTATVTVIVALPAPVIFGLHLSPNPFRAGTKPAKIFVPTKVPHAKRGTTIYLTLSEPANVTLTFAKAKSGREQGGSCLAPTHARRHLRRCTRYVPVDGSLSFALSAKPSRISFDGVLGDGKKLPAGRYQLTVVAQASSGPPSLPAHAVFTLRG